ncbi:MAG: hypothetical protein ACYTFY_00205 [Planctomycetota bacterium]|jgi:hypothetical protein
MQDQTPDKENRQFVFSKNTIVFAALAIFTCGLILSLFILAHYIGRMEGKIESLQSSLSIQQQLSAVPAAEFRRYSDIRYGTAPSESIRKNTEKIAHKPKNIERSQVKQEIKSDKVKSIDNLLVKSSLSTDLHRSKTTVTRKNTAEKTAFKAVLPKNGLKGTVLVVQPEQKRVMINVGKSLGLEHGRRFVLWRDGTYIGEVEAKDVFSDMTACEIITMSGTGIFVGDKVHEVPVEVADASGIESKTFRVTSNYASE